MLCALSVPVRSEPGLVSDLAEHTATTTGGVVTQIKDGNHFEQRLRSYQVDKTDFL